MVRPVAWMALASLALLGSLPLHAQTCPAGLERVAPDSRYVLAEPVAGERVATDSVTGLMWKQCSEGQSGAGCATGTATTMNWQQAFAAAASARTAVFAGYDDWRLPNEIELASLVETGCHNPAVNGSVFPATGSGYYWTSTTHTNAGFAWGVFLTTGFTSALQTTSNLQARLVRAGLALGSYDAAIPVPPAAPTVGTATAGDASATVAFAAPAYDGNSAITGYTAVSDPGLVTGTCGSSSCTVAGLSNGVSYTFTVHATNAVGDGAASATSNAVTPRAAQTIAFGNPGPSVLGDAPVTVSASGGGSGNPVTFASQTSAVCTTGGTDGVTVTLVAAGTCTVRASQAGTQAYAPAADVEQSFEVAAAVAGVVVSSEGSPVDAGEDVVLTATVSGIGPSGSVAFLVGAGTVADCGAQPLAGSGDTRTAQCIVSGLAAGEYAFSGQYAGDANNSAATSASFVQVVNGLPTLAAPASAQVLEDDSYVLMFTVTDAETAVGDLVVTVQSLDQTLVSDAALAGGLGGAGASRSLAIVPASDRFGGTTITLTVTDANGTAASVPVALAVASVNDAPQATFGPDQVHALDSTGPRAYAAFVGGVSTGPDNEHEQQVTLDASVDQGPFPILTGLSLDPDGTLSYSLTGEPGAALVRVGITDDGGTVNGGRDRTGHLLKVLVGDGTDLASGIERIHPDGASLPDALAASGGSLVSYRIVVLNRGPLPVEAAKLTLLRSEGLTGLLWTCTLASGSCAPAEGALPLDARFDLAVGESAQIVLSGDADTTVPFMEIVARAHPPAGIAAVFQGDDTVFLYEVIGPGGLMKNGFE